MASAHNSMDLAAIKKSMPKKVYEGTDMEDCDPAVLLNAQLFESIAIGAMDDIRTWVKHGAPVDSRNDVHGNGATPLIEAVTRKNEELAEYLISLGASPNLADSMGRTALHVACRLEHVPLTKLILDMKDVNLDARMAGTNATPLHLVSYVGHMELVSMLVEAGADVNALNKNDETPMHLAARNSHAEVVIYLLNKGADGTIPTKSTGHTPLHYACQYGSIEIAQALLQMGQSMHLKEASGRTALEIARAYGNHKLATNLLGAEREARETTERKRVAGVHAAIRAAEEARIARAEHERQLRLEELRRQKAELERMMAERAAAKKAAEEAALRKTIRDAKRRILIVAKEAKEKRDKRAAVAADEAARAAEEAAKKKAEEKEARRLYREKIHAAATRRVQRNQRKKAREDAAATAAAAAEAEEATSSS